MAAEESQPEPPSNFYRFVGPDQESLWIRLPDEWAVYDELGTQTIALPAQIHRADGTGVFVNLEILTEFDGDLEERIGQMNAAWVEIEEDDENSIVLVGQFRRRDWFIELSVDGDDIMDEAAVIEEIAEELRVGSPMRGMAEASV